MLILGKDRLERNVAFLLRKITMKFTSIWDLGRKKKVLLVQEGQIIEVNIV